MVSVLPTCLFAIIAIQCARATIQYDDLSDYPEVTTKLGKLRGKFVTFQSRKLAAYLGIPYAKPPVGELRFRKTQAVESWTGTKNATEFSPACLQYTPSNFPWYFDEPANESENCLYLNIWVPLSSQNKKAVMFWIHGGGFTLGSSRDPLYDGRPLAVNGDVIVVTVNYRLGPLGFLSSGTDDAPGNAGLYDILQALKWVNENIEAFNGDKNQVTIFGESAGGMAVGYLTVSNLAKGLYKRVILQSGSALLASDAKEANYNLTQQMAKSLNCADDQKTIRKNPKEVVDCLRRKPAIRLVMTAGNLRPTSSVTFLPVFGDEIVGVNPLQTMKQLKMQNVDVLIGVVKDEGSLFVSTSDPDYFGFFGTKDVFLNKTKAAKYLKNVSLRVTVTDDIVKYYFGKYREDDWGQIQKKLYEGAGDLMITCSTTYAAELYAKNNNVYFYSFERRPSITPWAPNQGVAHFEELQFVFGKPTIHSDKYLTTEMFFSKRMMQIWSSFAKTGVPEAKWPKFSRNEQTVRVLDISNKGTDKTSPHSQNCNFLRPFFEKSN